MSLQTSYRFIAPFYDVFLARATAGSRQRSLSRLPQHGTSRILLSVAGQGGGINMVWVQRDSMSLPLANESFDYVVLRLILSIVWLKRQGCLKRVVNFYFRQIFVVQGNVHGCAAVSAW
jgi:hypothetical protein